MNENENNNVEETNNNSDAQTNATNQANPVNQESQNNAPKKSNTGLIVTIVILAIVIVALIAVGVFIFTKNNVKNFVEEGMNQVSTVVEQGENILDQSGLLNTLNNSSDNSNSVTETNTVDNSSTTNEGANGAARESTLENPVEIGEWSIASKYNTNTSGNQNVNVRITNVIRGDEAKKMAQDYMSSDYSIYKYEEPEANLEWAVIEYDVDFADTYVPGELGASPNVEIDITGLDGRSIKDNGITYFTSVIEIGSRDYIKTKTGSGKALTQLPQGFTDYIIQAGAYGGTIAYTRGK